jgi:hypothetical protein
MRHSTYRITGSGPLRPMRERLLCPPPPMDTPSLAFFSLCPISFLIPFIRLEAHKQKMKAHRQTSETYPSLMIRWAFRILIRVTFFPTPPVIYVPVARPRAPSPFLHFFGPLTHRLSTILRNSGKYSCAFALVTWACREQRRGAVPDPMTHFIGILVPITLTYPTTTQPLHAPPDIA